MSVLSLYLKEFRLLALRVSIGREFQPQITDGKNEFQ